MLPEDDNPNNVEAAEDGADYLEIIEDLKKNTVSKDDYLKLKAENKRLFRAYANGQQLPEDQAKKPEPKDVDAMRKELFGKDHSNLEFMQQALDLREALMERGDPDPFLPIGSKISPDANDVEAAERVARVMKECIDYADGDSEVFTNELQRRTIDTAPMISKRRR